MYKIILSIYKYSSRKTLFLSKISEKYFKAFTHLYPLKLQSLHFDVPFFHANISTTNCMQHGQMKILYLKLYTICCLYIFFCCRARKYLTQMNNSFLLYFLYFSELNESSNTSSCHSKCYTRNRQNWYFLHIAKTINHRIFT